MHAWAVHSPFLIPYSSTCGYTTWCCWIYCCEDVVEVVCIIMGLVLINSNLCLRDLVVDVKPVLVFVVERRVLFCLDDFDWLFAGDLTSTALVAGCTRLSVVQKNWTVNGFGLRKLASFKEICSTLSKRCGDWYLKFCTLMNVYQKKYLEISAISWSVNNFLIHRFDFTATSHPLSFQPLRENMHRRTCLE